ncbi:MAG: hypothetical protein ACTSWD_07800 [Candidatus Heimdallarchaeota archaeon]
MIGDNIKSAVLSLKSESELDGIIDKLRVYAANKKSEKTIEIINLALQKSEELNNKKAIVNLLELKIKQIFSSTDHLIQIEKNLSSMKQISKEIYYEEGLILAFSIEWGVERFKGNEDESLKAIQKSMELLEACNNCSHYTYHITRYSYAINKWRREHNPSSADIFEECVKYFAKKGFYKGLIRALGYLSVIYFHTQKQNGIHELIKKFYSKLESKEIPKDLRPIIHYFIGATLELDFYLTEAENNFSSAKEIFESINIKNQHYNFYLPTLSHLSAMQSLKGELIDAKKNILVFESIFHDEFFESNLDKESKKQIFHTFNLIKFYIKSRMNEFKPTEMSEIINSILKDACTSYSNAIMLSEFLLNSELSVEQLINLKNNKNASIRRVEHIIDYLLVNTRNSSLTLEQRAKLKIEILQKKLNSKRMTLIERVLADLLVAQQLYSLKRYGEIYTLLKKYKKQLHRIEVLELRIFMEAFIQVGAFKSGDPLGPALQYMAIKKCRIHGFSRLENTLLNYLQIQHKEIRRTV